MNMRNIINISLIIGIFAIGYTEEILDKETVALAKTCIEKALKWAETTQNEDGSWTKYPLPGITGLMIQCFLKAGYKEDYPVVKKGIEYILSHVQSDGGIYSKGGAASQNTGICIIALHLTKNPKYEKIIENGRNYLKGIQFTDSSSKFYGGIGYGSKDTPNMETMLWALEALKKTAKSTAEERPTNDPDNPNVWDRAIKFLERCQNRKESNDQEWAGDDGGFIYSPEPESKAGGTRSYGSMTYAGLLSFIYCEVSKKDPRVHAAYNWIKNHYTLEENPELGYDGLFYYYHTFAKALDAYGENLLIDAKNKKHNWKKEFIEKMAKLQHKDGYWVNEKSKRWIEDSKELVTAYCILSLLYCISEK
jgi:squalene-hopene/tetraprenyl-beta-curcumene cyclase